MAPHSSTLAWKIPWMEEPGGLPTEWLHFHFSLSCIGEGNGNPLQCSCPENPRDGGAWWAAVYGVTQSWKRLKWLSRDFISPAWYNMGILCSSNGKESACDAGDHGSIPELGRSSGEGNGNPLQYSCLENSMDREAWQATFVGLQRVGHHWMTNIFYNSK